MFKQNIINRWGRAACIALNQIEIILFLKCNVVSSIKENEI